MFMAQLVAGRSAPAAYELVAAAAALGTFGSLMPSSGQHTAAAAAANITAPNAAAAAANNPSASTAAAEGTPASRGSRVISAAIAPPAAAAVPPEVASRLADLFRGGNLDKAALLALAKHLVTIAVSDDPSELATLAESTTQHLPDFRGPEAAPAAPAVVAATTPAATLTSNRKQLGGGSVTCFGSSSSLLSTQALEALTGEGSLHCSTTSSSPSGSESRLEFSPQSGKHQGGSSAQHMHMEEERFKQKLDRGLQEAAAAPFAWKRKHTFGLNTAAQQYVQEDQTPSSKRVRPGTDKAGHFRADQQQRTLDLALPSGLAQGAAYAPPALQSDADRSWPAPALALLPGCSFRGARDNMPAAGCSSGTTSRDTRACGRFSEGERQQQEEDAMEDEEVYPAACPAVASHPHSSVDGPRDLQEGGKAARREDSAVATSVARVLLEAVGLRPPPCQEETQQQRREQQEVAAKQPASSHIMQDTEEDEQLQQRWMRWGRMPQQPLQGAPGCKSHVFKVRQHFPAGHAAAEQSSTPTLLPPQNAGVPMQLYRPQRHAKASSPPSHYNQQQLRDPQPHGCTPDHAPQMSMFHQPVLAAGPAATSSAAAARPACPALPAALQQLIKQRQQHFQQQRQQSSTHQTQSDEVHEQQEQQLQLEQHHHYCQQQNHQKQQHPHQQQPLPQLDLQSLLAQVEQDAGELSGHHPTTQQLLLKLGQMAHRLGSSPRARHPPAGTLPPS